MSNAVIISCLFYPDLQRAARLTQIEREKSARLLACREFVDECRDHGLKSGSRSQFDGLCKAHAAEMVRNAGGKHLP